MNRIAFIGLIVLASAVQADTLNERLCLEARLDAERVAQARGLQVEARCRTMARQPGSAAGVVGQGWPAGQALRSGPVAWPVRVQGGALLRVPLSLSWTGPAWVSERALAAGSSLRAADLRQVQLRWPEGQAVELAGAQAPSGRLRHALRAGEAITAAALLPADLLQRGDAVTLLLRDGALELRLPAQLSAPARVGETVRVQAQGRTELVQGRLTDAQTVEAL